MMSGVLIGGLRGGGGADGAAMGRRVGDLFGGC